MFLMLNANLSRLYKTNDVVTVDEQLFPYRGRKMHSTLFGCHNDDNNDTCMVRYVPKENRSVLLLSTVHYNLNTVATQKKPRSQRS